MAPETTVGRSNEGATATKERALGQDDLGQGDDPRWTRRWSPAWARRCGWRWPLRLLVVAPIAVAAVRALARGWIPVGDDALLAVRAYDVGTSHHPWLGSWTSASLELGIDVNNPGALYACLLTPVMWTVGRLWSIAAGVAIGVALVNTVAALATMVVASRIGGWRAERWAMLMVSGLIWSMGSELLFDLWQPHALLLPFVLLLMLTTAIAAGQSKWLPLWLAVACVIVQTHLAYVFVVTALGGLVGAMLLWRWWRPDPAPPAPVGEACGLAPRAAGRDTKSFGVTPARPDHAVQPGDSRRADESGQPRHRRGRRLPLGRRAAIASVIVVATAWAQPVWEQLFGEGRGNLSRLASGSAGGEVTIGTSNAVKIFAAVTAGLPGWTRHGFADTIGLGGRIDTPDGPRVAIPGLPGALTAACSVAVVLAVLAVLLTLSIRRRTGAAAPIAVALVATLTALATLPAQSVTLTGLGNHQVRWLFALAPFVQGACLWGVVELVRARRRDLRGAGAAGEPAQPVPAETVERRRIVAGGVAIPALVSICLAVAGLGFYAHPLGPTADRAAEPTLRAAFDQIDLAIEAGLAEPLRFDTSNLRVYEPYSSAVLMHLAEAGLEFRFSGEVDVRQFGASRRASGQEPAVLRQYERGTALGWDGDGCVLANATAVSAAEAVATDAVIMAAVDALINLDDAEVALGGLPPDVAELVAAAVDGDLPAAIRTVADSLLPVLVAERRLPDQPAFVAAVDAADAIIARVNSTLLVTAEPASACTP